nr:FtsX-like permease family protein [Actinoplanes lichenicola]
MIALVLAMVWARRGQAAVVALLAMFGVAAAVAAPAYLRAADRAVAAGQVETAAPDELTVAVRAFQTDQRQAKPNTDRVGPDLEQNGSVLLGMPGYDYVYSVDYPSIGIEPSVAYATRFAYRQDVCDHLVVTAGRCLIGEADVILPEATGERLKLAPGDSIELMAAIRVTPRGQPSYYAPNGTPKRFLVAGLYTVPDQQDIFWGEHNYFAPTSGLPAGANQPAFVTSATVHAMDRGAVEAGLDAFPRPGALEVDNLPAVREGLAAMQAGATSLGGGVEFRSELPALLTRIEEGREAGHRIVPVLAVALVLLACLTIFLAVGYGTEGRRPELAVVALRGARWGQRWWLASGENIVSILLGAILGCLAGQLLVNAFSAYRFPGVGADPGLGSLRWAPVAAAAAVLTALLAERRQIATPVAELLRRAPSVPNSARAIAVEVVVVILAVVAVLQLSTELRGVGTAAAALVLVAGSLVAARLLVPLATVLGRRSLRRGRVGLALAALQISRRPGAVRLFALITAAVAVVGYAASAVDVAARGRVAESTIGTGAARVLEVGPTGRQNLLAAVRAVDPSGTFAMAAMRLPRDPGQPSVVAVDTSRLATVAAWPANAPTPTSVADSLRGKAGAPVEIAGAEVEFDITSHDFKPGKAVGVSAVLSPPQRRQRRNHGTRRPPPRPPHVRANRPRLRQGLHTELTTRLRRPEHPRRGRPPHHPQTGRLRLLALARHRGRPNRPGLRRRLEHRGDVAQRPARGPVPAAHRSRLPPAGSHLRPGRAPHRQGPGRPPRPRHRDHDAPRHPRRGLPSSPDRPHQRRPRLHRRRSHQRRHGLADRQGPRRRSSPTGHPRPDHHHRREGRPGPRPTGHPGPRRGPVVLRHRRGPGHGPGRGRPDSGRRRRPQPPGRRPVGPARPRLDPLGPAPGNAVDLSRADRGRPAGRHRRLDAGLVADRLGTTAGRPDSTHDPASRLAPGADDRPDGRSRPAIAGRRGRTGRPPHPAPNPLTVHALTRKRRSAYS